MAKKSTPSLHVPRGTVTVEECQAMIEKSLQTPNVRFLRQQMEKAGCPVGDNFFKARHCGVKVNGAYSPGDGIIVCINDIRFQFEVNQLVTHELIHAFDHCRAANLEWTNCAHHACSEIRSHNLSGNCHYKMELLRGFTNLRGQGQECIKRGVMKSVGMNPKCAGSAAKESMEAVWDICYNDTQPFDRAP